MLIFSPKSPETQIDESLFFQSLFSTTAFGLGGKYFAFYEEEGVGVQWNNIYISPVEDDQYNLLMVLMMMMFDAFLYGILAWYIENVFPGKVYFLSLGQKVPDYRFMGIWAQLFKANDVVS